MADLLIVIAGVCVCVLLFSFSLEHIWPLVPQCVLGRMCVFVCVVEERILTGFSMLDVW